MKKPTYKKTIITLCFTPYGYIAYLYEGNRVLNVIRCFTGEFEMFYHTPYLDLDTFKLVRLRWQELVV